MLVGDRRGSFESCTTSLLQWKGPIHANDEVVYCQEIRGDEQKIPPTPIVHKLKDRCLIDYYNLYVDGLFGLTKDQRGKKKNAFLLSFLSSLSPYIDMEKWAIWETNGRRIKSFRFSIQ